MEDNVVYWIWLQQALGYGNRKVKQIAELYDDIEKFYQAGETEWRLSGLFTNKDIENLNSTKLEDAQTILADCDRICCDVIGLDDERFPELLGKIDDPPAVLYVWGDIMCVADKLTVAVVGTRKASPKGLSIAEEISEGLARKNVVIVSGGALGIDSMAHKSAVEAGGKTVCVLGYGLDYNYLSIQNVLKQNIMRTGGAIVSEYPPGVPGAKWTFPARNRIISGLAHGTVIVEAGENSGSWITANLANRQNRDVFIVPPAAGNFVAIGSVALMEAGAQKVACAEDILKNYDSKPRVRNKPAFRSVDVSKKFYEFDVSKICSRSVRPSAVNQKVSKTHDAVSKLTDRERQVYEMISKGRSHIDDIVEALGMPSYKVLAVLTQLEIAGVIKSLPGKCYEII